jgi:hypothetical protein
VINIFRRFLFPPFGVCQTTVVESRVERSQHPNLLTSILSFHDFPRVVRLLLGQRGPRLFQDRHLVRRVRNDLAEQARGVPEDGRARHAQGTGGSIRGTGDQVGRHGRESVELAERMEQQPMVAPLVGGGVKEELEGPLSIGMVGDGGTLAPEGGPPRAGLRRCGTKTRHEKGFHRLDRHGGGGRVATGLDGNPAQAQIHAVKHGVAREGGARRLAHTSRTPGQFALKELIAHYLVLVFLEKAVSAYESVSTSIRAIASRRTNDNNKHASVATMNDNHPTHVPHHGVGGRLVGGQVDHVSIQMRRVLGAAEGGSRLLSTSTASGQFLRQIVKVIIPPTAQFAMGRALFARLWSISHKTSGRKGV